MKFLIDVNASGSLARWLVDRGHDVRLVKDVDPKMADQKILELALGEKRIIVTTDQDFEEMIWQEKKDHAGIVRLENLPRAERLALFEYICEHHTDDLEMRAIIVATSRKIRVRKRAGKN